MKKVLTIIFLLAAVCNLYSQNLKPSAAKSHYAEQVDMRELVSEADLVYTKPVDRSEAGMPLGNGVMGTLVWTTPSAIKMQINRNDVFAVNRSTDSFMERHSDYASGCGYVDINVVDYGDDVFSGDSFNQHLHLYDGIMDVKGNGLKGRMIAINDRDVIAVEIEDNRQKPTAINIDLRMLRFIMQYFRGENFELSSNHIVRVKRRGHTAQSQLHINGDKVILTQEFREKDFYNSSAVAVSVRGRDSKARFLNESTVRLSVAPGNGKFTIYISSDGGDKRLSESIENARRALDNAKMAGFDKCIINNSKWWHKFWSKSYVNLHSEDGVADYVEKNYTYFQYIMACSSRGLYQPRYGGMLWYTNGDMREWGSQYWWNNQSCYYNALPPTNRLELMDPLFSMFNNHLDSYATAARQQWGSAGLWFPETTFFDGLEEMPEDIASEMRELYLTRKPWEERSPEFKRYAETKPKHNPRWNWATVGRWENGHWIIPEKGVGPFGHVTHIFSATPEIAYLYWLRYEYSGDENWLREFAYPVIRGAVEFYRNFPNLRKESDGKYHIYHTNVGEGIWDAHNSFLDIGAIRGLTPILIRASEILGTDAEMRPLWDEFLKNISPLPSTEIIDNYPEDKPDYWIGSVPPAGHGNPESPQLLIYYDYCTAGTRDTEILERANASFDAIYRKGVNKNTPVHVLDKRPVAAALLGRSEAIKYLIPNQIRSDISPEKDFCDWKGSGETPVLPNRMTLREGPGAIGCQRLGNAATALNNALLQSVPPEPGGEPVIYLFPAWPGEWDADFSLLARGGFIVSASIKNGKIGDVVIKSQNGGDCRIKNPWPGSRPTLYRNGSRAGKLKGDLFSFRTSQREIIKLEK
ncbi:MAG TPA: glycoside hydrolase [Bacteroidetes bacterium]|nr:glycoside hydrolase [Bacteroidota bacterium]